MRSRQGLDDLEVIDTESRRRQRDVDHVSMVRLVIHFCYLKP